MYCMNCGFALPEDSKFCQNCGAAIDAEGNATPRGPALPVQPAAAYPYAQQTPYQDPYARPAAAERRVNSTPYLVWAIIMTVLFFWPTGIPAIVYAAKINRCYEEGNPALARDAAKKSKNWSIISAFLGVVFGILGAVLLAVKYGG